MMRLRQKSRKIKYPDSRYPLNIHISALEYTIIGIKCHPMKEKIIPYFVISTKY